MKDNTSAASIDEAHLYSDHDVAEFCGVSVHAVRRWRLNRLGPQYVRIGRKIRYRGSDILKWMAELPSGDVIENHAA